MSKKTTRFLTATTMGLMLFFGIGIFMTDDPLAGKDSLTLRVNDAEGEAGGLVAVVIRTYSSRPLGQGQVCFRAASFGRAARSSAQNPNGSSTGPFVALEGFKVFGKGAVKADASMEDTADGQVVLLQFSSDTARVNQADGPLAVLYLRLRDDLKRRQEFRIGIDSAETLLFGSAGEPISVETKAGTLEIRGRSHDPRVEPDGDTVRPGDKVRIGVETFEPFSIASGRVGLVYDPAIAVGTPKVKMDRRHGRRKMQVDTSTPGLVLVDFTAKRGALNQVPGKIIEVALRTSRSVKAGTVSKLTFDPSLTFFADAQGNILPVKMGAKTLTFVGRSSGSSSNDEDSDTDGDSDDADTDGDTDNDDSDGDTDNDSDGDTDNDSDGDTDNDSDGDTDNDDSDGDTDNDDSDGDTDNDSD